MKQRTEDFVGWILIGIVVLMLVNKYSYLIPIDIPGTKPFAIESRLQPLADELLPAIDGSTASQDAMLCSGLFEALSAIVVEDARSGSPAIRSRADFKDRFLNIGDRAIGNQWSIGSRYPAAADPVAGHLQDIPEWPEGRQVAAQRLSDLAAVFAYVSSRR